MKLTMRHVLGRRMVITSFGVRSMRYAVPCRCVWYRRLWLWATGR